MKGIFLDIEATGLNPGWHCPIDIAFKVIDLTSGKLLGAFESIIRPTPEEWARRDPNSMDINKFTWEEVAQGKDAKSVSAEIINHLCNLQVQRGTFVFICQNPAFDRAYFNQLIDVYKQEHLNWPYHWLDLASMYWAVLVMDARKKNVPLPEKISFSKNAIASVYHLPPESPPHRAIKGVDHLISCYQAVLQAF